MQFVPGKPSERCTLSTEELGLDGTRVLVDRWQILSRLKSGFLTCSKPARSLCTRICCCTVLTQITLHAGVRVSHFGIRLLMFA